MSMATACVVFGCPHSSPCPSHSHRRVKAEHHKLYNTMRWRRFRQQVLNTQPLCVRCEARGFITLAVDLHHRIALTLGGAPLDPQNIEPLCKSCHSKETGAGR